MNPIRVNFEIKLVLKVWGEMKCMGIWKRGERDVMCHEKKRNMKNKKYALYGKLGR